MKNYLQNKFISFLRKKSIQFNLDVRSKDYENLLLSSLLKKNIYYNHLFFYKFLKWALSFFNVKTKITSKTSGYVINIQCKNVVHNFVANDIKTINVILLKCLIIKSRRILYFIKVKNIGLLFESYKRRYYKKFSMKFLRKEMLTIKYLSSLYVNNNKYSYILPNIKSLIKYLYNKKIELNIIKLKYLHLNSDIFSQAIAVKLRKKGNNLLKILRRSMKLVNLPEFNVSDLTEDKNLVLNEGKQYKDLSLNWKTGITDVLDNIKYKWVTGVRVEARGRLTRRFTASRALFKFKYKGNLKNLETSKNILSVPSIYFLRDEYKPNIQHSFVSSKKRIGVFGIKAWVSNN